MRAATMALVSTITASPPAILWERGMRLRVTPGVAVVHLDRSMVTTSARGAQGLYLGGTSAQAHVALERVGLVVVATRDITPIV
jgi:hypothetical protein